MTVLGVVKRDIKRADRAAVDKLAQYGGAAKAGLRYVV